MTLICLAFDFACHLGVSSLCSSEHVAELLASCRALVLPSFAAGLPVVTGAEIPLNCQLGGGLFLPHPNGVVIHPGSEIGANRLLFQQVTLAGACKLVFTWI